MTGLFLGEEELEELTGAKTPKGQRAWLKEKRWLFETNRCGRPRVARAYFERKLVGQVTTEEPAQPARHNFGALRVVK